MCSLSVMPLRTQSVESAQIDNSVKTPLNEQLDRLGKLIAHKFCHSGCYHYRTYRYVLLYMHDFAWLDFVTYILQTVMIAVALLAVSIPEGLPMAVTIEPGIQHAPDA